MLSIMEFSSFSSLVARGIQELHGYINHSHVEKMHAYASALRGPVRDSIVYLSSSGSSLGYCMGCWSGVCGLR